MRKVKIEADGTTRVVGGRLSAYQQKLLSENSPKPDDILTHMDALNEEIVESRPDQVVWAEESSTKVPEEPMEESTEEIDDLNLDDAIDEIREELIEEEPQTADPEEQIRDRILAILKNTPGAPNEKQIRALKHKYGAKGVNVIAFDEGDVYIYTHLRRGQWQKIQETMTEIQQKQGGGNLENKLREKVVQHAVLWPRPLTLEFFINSRAGVVDALYEAIMTDSYFLNQQQVMMLTTQL